jgi:hypothetical protein
LVKRQAESGLSVRAFCRQEGVSENSLYFWRRELPKRQRQSRQAARRETEAAPRDFIPLHVGNGSAATMELLHPLGYQIRVDGRLDPVMLRQLLDVLERRGEA